MKTINDNLAEYLYNYYLSFSKKFNNKDPWFDIFNFLEISWEEWVYSLFCWHDYWMEYWDLRCLDQIDKISIVKFKEILKLKKICIWNSECCEQTLVTNISPLKFLYHLEELDISNSNVSSLDPIWHLPNIKKIWIENTRISQEDIDLFKISHPNVLLEEQVYL